MWRDEAGEPGGQVGGHGQAHEAGSLVVTS